MDGSGGLPAALRLAAANLAAAAANVGRVLESVADALQPDDDDPTAATAPVAPKATAAARKPTATRAPRKPASSPRAVKGTTASRAPAPKGTRGRRPSA